MVSNLNEAIIKIEFGVVTEYPFSSKCDKYWEYVDWFAKCINTNNGKYERKYFKKYEQDDGLFYLNIDNINIGDIFEFGAKGKYGNKRKFGIVKSIKPDIVLIYITTTWLRSLKIQKDINSIIRKEKIGIILETDNSISNQII